MLDMTLRMYNTQDSNAFSEKVNYYPAS